MKKFILTDSNLLEILGNTKVQAAFSTIKDYNDKYKKLSGGCSCKRGKNNEKKRLIINDTKTYIIGLSADSLSTIKQLLGIHVIAYYSNTPAGSIMKEI